MNKETEKLIKQHYEKAAEYREDIVKMEKALVYLQNNPFNLDLVLQLKDSIRTTEKLEKIRLKKARLLELDNCSHIWARSSLLKDTNHPLFCIKCGLSFTLNKNTDELGMSSLRVGEIIFLNRNNIFTYDDFIKYAKGGIIIDFSCNLHQSVKISKNLKEEKPDLSDEDFAKEFLDFYKENVKVIKTPYRRFKGLR